MHTRIYIPFVIGFFALFSCRQYIEKETTHHKYYNLTESDTISQAPLIAITKAESMEYGVPVAFLNKAGDTIIPFGKYAYFGTDTLKHFATVIEHPNDTVWGRPIGIDRKQNVLFDLMLFDNGPDYFHEGLIRILRNQKMGYANELGQVVIPCKYDFAGLFEDGKARVALEAREYMDLDEHLLVESDEWFQIDKKGNKVKSTIP